jgi:hypothetical protein
VASEIDYRGKNKPQDVDSDDRKTAVEHPSVDQSCDRKKYEAEEEDEDAAVRPVQVMGEEEQKEQAEARERQDEDQEETGHGTRVAIVPWTPKRPGCFMGGARF